MKNVDGERTCVITVPSSFNREQRLQTLRACELAKLNCVWILEEPVAAVFYRAVMLKAYEKRIAKIWLAFDFGGGTLDVALVKVGQGLVELLATDGNNHLGGQDVDHALMERFIARYT